MCTGAIIAAVVAVAGAAVNASIAANEADWKAYTIKQANADAKAEKSAAVIHAEKIRALGRADVATANAALSASGVQLDKGTALVINRQIYKNSEEQAILSIYAGKQSAQQIKQQGIFKGKEFGDASTAAAVNSGDSLLKAYGSGKKAYDLYKEKGV